MISAIMLSTGVMAQRPNNINSKKEVNNVRLQSVTPGKVESGDKKGNDKVREGKPFFGTIDYDLKLVKSTRGKGMRKGDPKVAKESKLGLEAAPKMVESKAAVKSEPKDDNVFHFVFTKEGSFLRLGEFGIVNMFERPTIISTGVDDVIIGYEMRPVIDKEDLAKMEKDGSLMKKFYDRTGETKEIAGLKAVQYKCMLPQMDGELWVCEDYSIVEDFGPFVGMKHPVLEADVNIVVEDIMVEIYHIRAVNYLFNKFNDETVKKSIPTEVIPENEFLNRIRENGYDF